MKIVKFSIEIEAKWNTCCDHSSRAWLFHRAEWVTIEIEQLSGLNYSFAIIEGDVVVAIQPLYFTEVGLGAWAERLLHSGFHRHTGLACLDSLPDSIMRAAQKLAMKHIDELASQLRVDRIQLNVQNLTPESFSRDRQEVPFWVLDYGYHLGLRFGPMGIYPSPGMSTCAADQIIDLSQTEDALFAMLEDTCRRAVRKAESALLQVDARVLDASGFVDAYYELATASAGRTGEAIATIQYFRVLADRLAPASRLAMIFALHEGQRIACVLLGVDKGAATFLGGVSDPDFLHMRPNDFCHWSVIKWAKKSGLARYRLGPIFPELPEDWPISKVSRFKAKFGGRPYTTIQGSKFLNPEKYVANILNSPVQGT